MSIKGNQFWKQRSKHGRDKIFKTPDLMWEAACEYFQWCDDNPFQESVLAKYKEHSEIEEIPKIRPYTIQGLCLYFGVNKGYVNDFEDALKGKKDKISNDYSVILTRIRDIIYNQKFSGAASGFFNPNIIARDLGLSEKKEVIARVQVSEYDSMTDEEIKQEIDRLKKNS